MGRFSLHSYLVRHQVVDSAEKHLGGQIAALFTTKGAGHVDGLEGKLPNSRWDVAAAALAGDDKELAIRWSLEHANHDRRISSESRLAFHGAERALNALFCHVLRPFSTAILERFC
jgi:hypothetical protein